MTFLEMGSSWLFLCVVMLIMTVMGYSISLQPSQMDWIYLIALSLLCTTLAFSLSLKALEHLTAFTNNLVINLEPVYGMIMAAVLLHEYDELNARVYLGVFFILIVVLSYPYFGKKGSAMLTQDSQR